MEWGGIRYPNADAAMLHPKRKKHQKPETNDDMLQMDVPQPLNTAKITKYTRTA